MTTRNSGFLQTILTTLGSMQGTDSAVYFTATDVAYEYLTRTGQQPKIANREEFNKTVTRVITALSQCKRDVFVTDEKIRPKRAIVAFKHLKSANGYRVGVPIVPIVNKDIREECKVIQRLATDLNQNPVDNIKKILPILNYTQLTNLMSEIGTLMTTKHHELQNQHLELTLKFEQHSGK
jgi:hypothetical protein